MKAKEWMGLCPYGKGTAMQAIYAVLARSSKPLTMKEVSRRAKQAASTTRNMIAAMRSKYHGASLARAGVEVASMDGGYLLRKRKPSPEARRPEAKKAKKTTKKKARKRKRR